MIENICCCNHPIYMVPSNFVRVTNRMSSLQVFYTLKYIYNGRSFTKKSRILGLDEVGRFVLIKASTNRELTIYKNTGERPVFLFHTGNIRDEDTCFEVTGIGTHPLINRVPC